MAALPYMPLYVADYLADAAHLTTVEHGAYLLLIMTYWQRGQALPDSDRKLARIARMDESEWLEIRDDLAEFFLVADGVWLHGRIERELSSVRQKSVKAKSAAQKRWECERTADEMPAECERTADAMHTQCHTDTDTDTDTDTELDKNPPNPPLGFDLFWSRYPKRVGKGAAEKAWAKLKPPDRQSALSDLSNRPNRDPQWRKDDGQYIPNPATYLNQKRFLDDWQEARASPFSETTRQNIALLGEWANGN